MPTLFQIATSAELFTHVAVIDILKDHTGIIDQYINTNNNFFWLNRDN